MCVDSLPEPRVFPDQSNSAIDRCEKSGSQFTALGNVELCRTLDLASCGLINRQLHLQ
jgi:hypothetical protein